MPIPYIKITNKFIWSLAVKEWRPKYVSYHLIPFFLKILFKSQILTSIISFDHPNKDLCLYGVIFVKYIGKIDRFGQFKIEKIQKLEIYWLHFFKMEYKLQYKCVKFTNQGSQMKWCQSSFVIMIYFNKNPKNKDGLTLLYMAVIIFI